MTTVAADICAADIWQWLDEVPDPEIPVISLVDLGIVREVSCVGGQWHIALTPTYSGCPATQVIEQDIRAKLHANGIEQVILEQRIAPPWSSDWMSAKAHEALRNYGIAPPSEKLPSPASGRGAGGEGRRSPIWLHPVQQTPVACPHCGSIHTEKVSQFGSTPCKSNWRCLDCLEPFEYFKCI